MQRLSGDAISYLHVEGARLAKSLHLQYTIVAEWSQKIDSKSYTHLFSAVSRKGEWSLEAQTAWSAMTDYEFPICR